MVRHVSIMTFRDDFPNGKSKEENITLIQERLEKIPALYPAIQNSFVGRNLKNTFELPGDAPVLLGDLIQMIDFACEEEAKEYPASKAHIDLMAVSDPLVKKVTVIDFELKKEV